MTEQTRPDFIEVGRGHKIILLHSSVSGARQWLSLMDTISDRFHLIAINQYGYGKTVSWPDDRSQTLAEQASLITQFLEPDGKKISIVGHSFGGVVAMKAAAMFKGQVRRLVLIEPIPFYLLRQYGLTETYLEAVSLRQAIDEGGRMGSWEQAAKELTNYWSGDRSWDAMSDQRKTKFVEAMSKTSTNGMRLWTKPRP